jgi:hypothetical protein
VTEEKEEEEEEAPSGKPTPEPPFGGRLVTRKAQLIVAARLTSLLI